TEQIEQLRVSLGLIKKAEELALAEQQYKMLLQDKDFSSKFGVELLRAEEARMFLRCYEDIDFAVAKVAKKMGVTLVLPKQDIPQSQVPIAELGGRDLDDRLDAFQRRAVWYSSEELDLTGEVIKYMRTPLTNRPAPDATNNNGSDANGAKKG